MKQYGGINFALLLLLGAAAKQENQGFAIACDVYADTRSPIYFVFAYTSKPFDVREPLNNPLCYDSIIIS